jgi:hypothetical protein
MTLRSETSRSREAEHTLDPKHGAGRADIESQLGRLADVTTRDLRAAWQRYYRTAPPPRLSRDLLIRGIAWKVQETAYGGLSQVTRRRLRSLAKQLAAGRSVAAASPPTLRPGTRLVREWRGRVHTVTLIDDGFEYNGRSWSSLSQIAKAITGVHWSGPRFFGLTRSGRRVERADSEAQITLPTDGA